VVGEQTTEAPERLDKIDCAVVVEGLPLLEHPPKYIEVPEVWVIPLQAIIPQPDEHGT
jgi:hypothetical protein